MAGKSESNELDLGMPSASEARDESYVVLARKYRPQTFSDLAGQDTVARALSKAITDSRVPHALLFSGPRGVGKTSAARILAKALNCAKGPTPDPCGTCEHCVGITNGSDMDVIEIDGASHTGVDNIRELRERVNYTAFSASWKVYIIDEVHMLSQGAFNALLKTLEEPPPQVIFIFATTEPAKVPETIRSRCSWFQFARIDTAAMVARLEHVVSNEPDIQIAENEREETLHTIASAAEGGMRDALVTLDQLVALCDGAIDLAETRRLLGMVEQRLLIDIFEGLLAHDAKGLLEKVGEMAGAGQDFERLAKSICQFLRDLMILKTAGAGSGLIDVTGERLKSMGQLADQASHEQLLQFTRAFLDLEAEMKTASQPRILLEYTFIKLTVIDPVEPLDQLLNRLESIESGRGVAAPSGQSAPAASASAIEPSPPRAVTSAPAPVLQDSELAPESQTAPTPSAEEAPAPEKRDASDLEGLWAALRSAIGRRRQTLALALEQCVPQSVEGKTFTIAVPKSEHSLYDKSQIERDFSQQLLTETLERICGVALRVSVTETGGPVDEPAIARPVTAPKAAAAAPSPRSAAPEKCNDVEEPVTDSSHYTGDDRDEGQQAPQPEPHVNTGATISIADMPEAAREMLESPKERLDRAKREDPELAAALNLVVAQFNGIPTHINQRPLR